MEELGLRKTSRLVGSNKNQDSNLIIWLKIDTWYMLSWFWFHTVWPMSPQVRDSEMVERLWDVQRCLVPAPWKTGLSPACPLFHLDHLELCLALSRCSKKNPCIKRLNYWMESSQRVILCCPFPIHEKGVGWICYPSCHLSALYVNHSQITATSLSLSLATEEMDTIEIVLPTLPWACEDHMK